MYPAIGSYQGFRPPEQYPPPGNTSFGASTSQHTTLPDNSPWRHNLDSSLRIKIASEFKVEPPVKVPAALEAASRPLQTFDFDFENEVLREADEDAVAGFLESSEGARTDPNASRFIGMGHSPAAVYLALAYQMITRDGKSQATVSFCENFSKLLGMGLRPAHVAGALLKTKNDVSAAADLCLAADG